MPADVLLVAARGVLARRLRVVLTSIAVVLGVGFVAGAFFLTDSLRSSFDTLFTEAAQGIDVRVQTDAYKDLVAEQARQGPAAAPINRSEAGVPPEVVERIREVPGVRHAAGSVFENAAQPLGSDGEPLGGGGPPTFAANWVDEAPEVSALRISRGTPPGPDEVMLDAVTMEDGGFAVGDEVRILIQDGRKVEAFRISGEVTFGSSNNLNGASITVFETGRVQELLDMGDRFTAISVQAEEGVSQQTLRRRVADRLGPGFDVITGDQFTQEQAETIDTAFLGVLQNVILGFAAVAVFVGAFTIFNTFSILVGQRTREFGLLRAIGASRRQVLGIVTAEALLIGLVASTSGIAAGYGIAWLLRELINAFAVGGIPEAPFPLRARTVAAAYAVGVGVTLVASMLPGWRASRLSPLEALRANPAHAGRGWKPPAAGALLCLAGGALVYAGFAGGGSLRAVLTQIGGGFAVAIVGIALLSRLFIAPVTRVLATALGRGPTGELATRNVLRNRARSATTASALMVGLALAALVLVFHASINRTVERQIDEVLRADITIYNTTTLSTGVGVVQPSALDDIERTPGVERVVGQRVGAASTGDRFRAGALSGGFVAFDDGAFGDDGVVGIELAAGRAEPGDGLLVDTDFARDEDWQVGEEVQLAFPGGITHTLEVVGLFEPNDIVGASLIASIETFDRVQPTQQQAPAFVYVNVEDGARIPDVATRIERSLGTAGSFLAVQDSEGLRQTFTDQLAPILGLVLGMLSLSLVIALFGIGNTLALNVFERTREIGLIRAVGGTQRQLRRIIRVEAILVAVFGAVVGVLVGVAAGAALIKALEDEGFIFSPNLLGLGAVLLAGLVAGLVASVLPARRAARTDVLQAIATE